MTTNCQSQFNRQTKRKNQWSQLEEVDGLLRSASSGLCQDVLWLRHEPKVSRYLKREPKESLKDRLKDSLKDKSNLKSIYLEE